MGCLNGDRGNMDTKPQHNRSQEVVCSKALLLGAGGGAGVEVYMLEGGGGAGDGVCMLEIAGGAGDGVCVPGTFISL